MIIVTFYYNILPSIVIIYFQYGVTDIFSEKADLSGITSEELRLGDLVQMVTVQVDEGNSEANYLTGILTIKITS